MTYIVLDWDLSHEEKFLNHIKKRTKAAKLFWRKSEYLEISKHYVLTPLLWMASFSSFTTSSPSTPEQLKPFVQRIRMLCSHKHKNIIHHQWNQSSTVRRDKSTSFRSVRLKTLSISFCSQGKEKVKPSGRVCPFRFWESRNSLRQAAMWSNSWKAISTHKHLV